MEDMFSRSALLLGEDGISRLKNSRIAVFGAGGVGGYALEAFARSGVGEIDIFDSDTVSVSNLNRQIIATTESIGRYKTEVARDRILSIHPSCKVTLHTVFYSPENAEKFDLSVYDYVIDAIDSVSSKIELIVRAKTQGVRIISSMGAGNKLDPTAFEVADIYKTSVCPLARALRSQLKKRGVDSLKVVYSREEPIKPEQSGEVRVPGSVAFVPSVAGLVIAGEVIKDIAFSK